MAVGGAFADEIREQVRRITRSTGFAGAPRLRKFLEYSVEQLLLGKDSELKEQVIAVEVFGRDTSYDPQRDATVRVTAGKLRARLDEYYRSDGAADPIRISLNKGRYVPSITIRDAATTPKAEPARDQPWASVPSTAQDIGPKRSTRPRAAVWVSVCSILVIAAAAVKSGYSPAESGRARAPSDFVAGKGVSSIAVLPFHALVPEPSVSDEALGLALADTLITRLGNSTDLIVRSISSVREVASKEMDPVEAGKRLRVSAVIDGSFQREGGRIRLTARLVRTKDGKHLWGGEFDEKSEDTFVLQEMLTDRVAGALMVQVTRSGNTKAPSPEVFDLCSRGRYHMLRYTPDDARKALHFYAAAAGKDPTYAPAYAGMAWEYIQHAEFGLMPNSLAWPQARAAAQQAVQLNNLSFEAHIALGHIYFGFAWDWEKAERSFKHALALNPHHTETLGAYRSFLVAMGQLNEALAVSERMKVLDPFSPSVNLAIANTLLTMRRYDEAIQVARSTLELMPEFPRTHGLLAEVYYRKGAYDEWFRANARAAELAHEPLETRAALQVAYKHAGVRGYWRKTLELLLERSRKTRVSPITLAGVYAELGEKHRAFEYLDKAYADKEPNIVHLKTSPTFDPLRSDQRYTALLERMKL